MTSVNSICGQTIVIGCIDLCVAKCGMGMKKLCRVLQWKCLYLIMPNFAMEILYYVPSGAASKINVHALQNLSVDIKIGFSTLEY